MEESDIDHFTNITSGDIVLSMMKMIFYLEAIGERQLNKWKYICIMNNNIVDEIKIELVKLSQYEEIANIISSSAKNFTADFLDREYQKIVSAQEKDYPTYRSEYRIIKTLDRYRKLIIYHLVKSKNKALLDEMIVISRLIKPLLRSIGDIFSLQEAISNAAKEFDDLALAI